MHHEMSSTILFQIVFGILLVYILCVHDFFLLGFTSLLTRSPACLIDCLQTSTYIAINHFAKDNCMDTYVKVRARKRILLNKHHTKAIY